MCCSQRRVPRQRAALVPQHDDALVADLLDEVVPRPGDPVLSPNAQPSTGEDPLRFLREDLGGDVVAAGQGPGPVDGNLGGLEEWRHGFGLD